MTDGCMGCRVPGYSHAAYCPEGRVEELRSRLAEAEFDLKSASEAMRRYARDALRLKEAEALANEVLTPWPSRRMADGSIIVSPTLVQKFRAFLAADSAPVHEKITVVGATPQYDPLRTFTEGQAGGDCTYGDGCPPEAKHYRCVSCLARSALREAALRELQQESERLGLYDAERCWIESHSQPPPEDPEFVLVAFTSGDPPTVEVSRAEYVRAYPNEYPFWMPLPAPPDQPEDAAK